MDKNKKSKIKSGEGFTVGESGGFALSLGALLGKEPPAEEEKKTAAEEMSQASKTVPTDKTAGKMKLSKVSLQHQTSGRGGKTVTVVTLPKESAVDKEELARELRRGLGCGSRVEDG